MKKMMKKSAPYFLAFCAICVFLYFFMITRLTPLAGDDWGYAINGLKGNPFLTLIDFYKNWSGRIVSEFWGLVVAPRKWLWNLLNPLLFATIFVMINLLANKKKSWTGCSLILVLMFTVSEYLRMETYTWIMGTTYVIPLCLMLFYFWIAEKTVFSDSKMSRKCMISTSVLTLFAAMSMENASAMLIVGIVLMIGYVYFERKQIRYDYLMNLAGAILGFLVMRMSPGSTFRTERDHGAWMDLSLFEKIENQLSNFFRYTFTENKYLIFILAFVLLAALVFKGIKWIKEHKVSAFAIVISQCGAVLFSSANMLASIINLPVLTELVNVDSLVVRGWWLVYVLFVFFALIVLVEDKKLRLMSIFFLMMAGGSNMVMLYSPIFGSRSSLYFVYFMFVVIVLVFSDVNLPHESLDILLCAVFMIFTVLRAKSWYIKYQQVHRVQMIREAEIQYYREHPDEDAWICRVPPYSVHGADIEEGDTYHFDTFKEYYGLDPEQNIIFYWKDSYSE